MDRLTLGWLVDAELPLVTLTCGYLAPVERDVALPKP